MDEIYAFFISTDGNGRMQIRMRLDGPGNDTPLIGTVDTSGMDHDEMIEWVQDTIRRELEPGM